MTARRPAVASEHQQGEILPVEKKKVATRERKARQPLKDIGNSVNVLVAESFSEIQPQLNRRVTRSFGAQLLANEKSAAASSTAAKMHKPAATSVDGSARIRSLVGKEIKKQRDEEHSDKSLPMEEDLRKQSVDEAAEVVGKRVAKKSRKKGKIEKAIELTPDIEEEHQSNLVNEAAERVSNLAAKKLTNRHKVDVVGMSADTKQHHKQSMNVHAEKVGKQVEKRVRNKCKVEEAIDFSPDIEEEKQKESVNEAAKTVRNPAAKKLTKRKVQEVVNMSSDTKQGCQKQSADEHAEKVGKQVEKRVRKKCKVEEAIDFVPNIEEKQQEKSSNEATERITIPAAKTLRNKRKIEKVVDMSSEIKQGCHKQSADGPGGKVGKQVAKKAMNKHKVKEATISDVEEEEQTAVGYVERVGIRETKIDKNKRKLEEVIDVSSEIEKERQKQSVDGAKERVCKQAAKRVKNIHKAEEVIYMNSKMEEEQQKQSAHQAVTKVGDRAVKTVKKKPVTEANETSCRIIERQQKQSTNGAMESVGNRAAKVENKRRSLQKFRNSSRNSSSEIKEECQKEYLSSSVAPCSIIPNRITLTSTLLATSKLAHDTIAENANDQFPDVEDQSAVADNAEDIYKFYKIAERSCQPHDYMNSQVEINEKMRAVLVDWLIEVHYKFKLMPETLFLTFYIIDRYLSMEMVLRRDLQLVGVSAMLIATKYEEKLALEVNDFICESDRAYTREQILDVERRILNKLEWNLAVPTPYLFLKRFLKAALRDKEMEHMVFFFAELGSMQYSTILYCPSLFAASAVYAARCTLKKRPYWTKTLKNQTGFSEEQLLDCAQILVNSHSSAPESKLRVVYDKYSSKQLGAVALRPPAILVFDKLSKASNK